jgi:hypothetical protein
VISANLDESTQILAESLVHEYVHSFGDGFGIRWFMEDERFTNLAESTPPFGLYNDEFDMALEYIVRAYTIKYFDEKGDDEAKRYSTEKTRDYGFIYIDDVYEMITEKWVP